jgi:hypothetical protein
MPAKVFAHIFDDSLRLGDDNLFLGTCRRDTNHRALAECVDGFQVGLRAEVLATFEDLDLILQI